MDGGTVDRKDYELWERCQRCVGLLNFCIFNAAFQIDQIVTVLCDHCILS